MAARRNDTPSATMRRLSAAARHVIGTGSTCATFSHRECAAHAAAAAAAEAELAVDAGYLAVETMPDWRAPAAVTRLLPPPGESGIDFSRSFITFEIDLANTAIADLVLPFC